MRLLKVIKGFWSAFSCCFSLLIWLSMGIIPFGWYLANLKELRGNINFKGVMNIFYFCLSVVISIGFFRAFFSSFYDAFTGLDEIEISDLDQENRIALKKIKLAKNIYFISILVLFIGVVFFSAKAGIIHKVE